MAIFSELRRLQTAAVYVGCYSYTKVAVSRVRFLVSSVLSAQAEQLAIKKCGSNLLREQHYGNANCVFLRHNECDVTHSVDYAVEDILADILLYD